MTSRDPAWRRQVTALLPVEVLDRVESVRLLRLLAYLGPDKAPWDLLVPGLAELEKPPGSLGGLAPAALDRSLGALARYSLTKRAGADVTVYRLVQQVVRDGLDPDEQRTWAAAAVELLMAVFPFRSDWPQNRPVCQRLLPHTMVATAHAEEAEPTPPATGTLVNQVGMYVQARAECYVAKTMYERALRIDQATHGPDHPRTRIVANNLAALNDDQERESE